MPPKKRFTTAELDAMEAASSPKKTFTTAELDAMEAEQGLPKTAIINKVDPSTLMVDDGTNENNPGIRPGQAISAGVMSLIRGRTLGLSDPVAGAMRAVPSYLGNLSAGGDESFGDIYSREINKVTGGINDLREDSPYLSGALEMIGGSKIGMPGGLQKGGTLARMGKGAIAAGLSGLVYGSSTTEGDAGQRLDAGLESGAYGAVIGGAVPAVQRVFKGGANAADDLAKSYEKDVFGIRRVDNSKGKALKTFYTDDLGNKVPVRQATQTRGLMDEAIETASESGFINKLSSSSPNKVLTQIDQELSLVGDEIGGLVRQVSSSTKGTRPKLDISRAINYIDEADPDHARSLTKSLKNYSAKWGEFSQDLEGLQKFKQYLGKKISFKPNMTEKESSKNEMLQELYYATRDRVNQIFDDAASIKKPDLVGKLAKANKKYSSLQTLRKPTDFKESGAQTFIERLVKGSDQGKGAAATVIAASVSPALGVPLGIRQLLNASPLMTSRGLSKISRSIPKNVRMSPSLAGIAGDQLSRSTSR